MTRIVKGVNKKRKKLLALHKHSDTANAKVLDEWIRLLKSLHDLPLSAQSLVNMIVKNYAFSMAYPVTLEMFAEDFLPQKKCQGYTLAAFKKAVKAIPKLKHSLLQAGVNLHIVEDLPRKALDGKLNARIRKDIREYLGNLALVQVVRGWFNTSRGKLQAALCHNADLGFWLTVESIPRTYTAIDETGYIIPGTCRSLQYFIDKDSGYLARRMDFRANRVAARKSIVKSPVKRAKRKRKPKKKK